MKRIKVNKKNLKLLIISLIPLLGSLLISYIIKDYFGIYQSLTKPYFAPPAIVFAIVWPILYILMGVSSAIIGQYEDNDASFIFYVQLLLNYLWPILFFILRLYAISFFELIILFLLIIITTFKFFKINKIAGILFIPYILWTIYAGYLNFMVWMYNEM